MKFFPLADFQPSQNRLMHPKEITALIFQRTVTLEGLQKEFTKILLYPKGRREKWLVRHQDFIHQMLHHVRQESSYVVNEALSNRKGQKQVTEYMVTLQQTLMTLEKIVDEFDEFRD